MEAGSFGFLSVGVLFCKFCGGHCSHARVLVIFGGVLA